MISARPDEKQRRHRGLSVGKEIMGGPNKPGHDEHKLRSDQEEE
jgi:hypothetical protein